MTGKIGHIEQSEFEFGRGGWWSDVIGWWICRLNSTTNWFSFCALWPGFEHQNAFNRFNELFKETIGQKLEERKENTQQQIEQLKERIAGIEAEMNVSIKSEENY